MWSKCRLVFLAGCLATLGLAACSDDDATCGDGKAEGNEQCDLTDLKGNTCTDVLQGSTGTLACDQSCTFNTSGCILCGDGQLATFGEQCDCGTDINNLPAGCTDVNGGANANCSATCGRVAKCGDGRVDSPEECDCGTDAATKPAACPDVNGGANANCNTDCTEIIDCPATDPWSDCDTTDLNACAVDDWDESLECTSLPSGSALWLRPCGEDGDCYWNNYCESGIGSGVCWPQLCSGDYGDEELMGVCQVAGGGVGICYPAFGRNDENNLPDPTGAIGGLCTGEEGTNNLQQGETCTNFSDPWSVDRVEETCYVGRCLGTTSTSPTGTCYQLCSPDQAYDNVFHAGDTPDYVCPTDTNCLNLQSIDPANGLTGGSYGLCWDTKAVDSTNGETSCDVVTGALLTNVNQTCDDVASGMVCEFLDFSSTERTDGFPMGVCTAGPTGSPTILNALDTCTPNSSTAVCPPQSTCERVDAFATTPAGRYACLPYCDTEYTDCQARVEDLGGPIHANLPGDASPLGCTSFSEATANGRQDIAPSRAGLCIGQ